HEAFVVTQAPGREAAFHRFAWARVHAGRGIAASREGLFASTDGGATWAAVPAPDGFVEESVADVERLGTDSFFWAHTLWHDHPVDVSEVGARIGWWLRI